MIEAQVIRHNQVIMERLFKEPGLTLEGALARLEAYVLAEGLNANGECNLKVRFPGPSR